VTPAIRAERGIRSEEGVLIFKVAPEVTQQTTLREGDVILAINRTPVRKSAQVGELLNVRAGEILRIYLERDGQITFTDLVFR
jgi:membrane-associated protease RseP (regulator of RpoE activity)